QIMLMHTFQELMKEGREFPGMLTTSFRKLAACLREVLLVTPLCSQSIPLLYFALLTEKPSPKGMVEDIATWVLTPHRMSQTDRETGIYRRREACPSSRETRERR